MHTYVFAGRDNLEFGRKDKQDCSFYFFIGYNGPNKAVPVRIFLIVTVYFISCGRSQQCIHLGFDLDSFLIRQPSLP